jgi:hypothetical protein
LQACTLVAPLGSGRDAWRPARRPRQCQALRCAADPAAAAAAAAPEEEVGQAAPGAVPPACALSRCGCSCASTTLGSSQACSCRASALPALTCSLCSPPTPSWCLHWRGHTSGCRGPASSGAAGPAQCCWKRRAAAFRCCRSLCCCRRPRRLLQGRGGGSAREVGAGAARRLQGRAGLGLV